MTFRQILDVLWSRRWLIAVMVVVAVGVAIAYLQLRTIPYTSTEVVRENSTFSQAAQSGEIGSVQVDFDPSTITTEKVLGPAATSLGLSRGALLGNVADSVKFGTQTTTIDITATGMTAEASQQYAQAVVKQYGDYLQQQLDTALATLGDRQKDTRALAQQYQSQVNADAKNSIAQAGLATTLADLASVDDQISTIKNAGSPLIVMTTAQPGSPVGPSRLTVLMVALVAGLIAGMGVALIRDQFDDKLRGEHEIEPLTGLRSLGELPFDRHVSRGKDVLPAAGTQPTALLEGLRAVRTSTQVLLPANGPGGRVVVVTSAQPGDGKTFVAANLALSFARAGKKVVLVDGDLRRPSLRRYFLDAAVGDGLAKLLELSSSGQAFSRHDIDAELHTTPYAGLRVLPAGESAEAMGDLLAASDLSSIIGHLRAISDIVIIDSPPSLAVVDATLLAKQADGVVLVGAVGKVDRSLLAGAAEALRQNGVRLLGIVTNRSRRAIPKPNQAYYIRSAARRAA
ncbi:polysaccharide biosynthesis tyrosine autokinase [Gryllotalpicola ginsengisoli]|uniref:polysaccharide biosynthesis tyrosine autokinase n=1 Tax=Gryllotalpicola ginsengisoli TaxID=444608 RepID=UPI0003B6645D|nr:polysaccharide biosynthesis tyrosine autokinase [Gryllotalpicola ginsengisoli]